MTINDPNNFAPIHFNLPEVACSTPPRVNPDYPTIYERNAAWVRRFLPFPSAEALECMLENRYPLWECMIFPWGLADRVFQSSCATSLMFEMDDVALLERALFNEVAADWVAEHPYGAAFKDVLETLKNNMPHGIWDRYLKDWQDYFTAALKENEFRARYEIPDLDTYLEIRRPSIGLYPYIVCMEYVLDLDLTELIPNDPDFWLVKTAAIEHGIMVNDLFSYRLEVIRGDFFNAITSLLQVHLHDLQSAVDLVAEKIRQADDAVTRLCGNLRRRYANHPYGPRIHTYTETIGAFCAGTLRWSLESSRYNGRGYGWNGRRAGAITLGSQRTTIAGTR